MDENNTLPVNPSDSFIENKITLYSSLTEQLFKHQAVIWQIPIALIVGNFVVLEKFYSNLYVLWSLALFNFGLIFVWYRMIKSQKVIIKATRKAEKHFNEFYKGIYDDFLPDFGKKGHHVFAPYLFLFILTSLEIFLIIYNLILWCSFKHI